MNKSSRRVLRTTAAVLGMTALGAVGSGTAFADTMGDVHGVNNGHGDTDFAPADDSAGLPSDELGAPDMHTFQMPSLGDQNVRSTRSSSSSHDGDSGSSSSSDESGSGSSSSDESGTGSTAKSKSKSTEKFQSANYKSRTAKDDSTSDSSSRDSSSKDSSSKDSGSGSSSDNGNSGQSSGGLGGLSGLL